MCECGVRFASVLVHRLGHEAHRKISNLGTCSHRMQCDAISLAVATTVWVERSPRFARRPFFDRPSSADGYPGVLLNVSALER